MDEELSLDLAAEVAQFDDDTFIWGQLISRPVQSSTADADAEEDIMSDTRDIVYPGIIKVVPGIEAGLKVAFYAVIMVIALFGNMFVIVIVYRSKRMHTTTNYYLVNLAVSDLAVILSCSWVHLVTDLSEGWTLGAFFCKFNSFVQGKATHLDVNETVARSNR